MDQQHHYRGCRNHRFLEISHHKRVVSATIVSMSRYLIISTLSAMHIVGRREKTGLRVIKRSLHTLPSAINRTTVADQQRPKYNQVTAQRIVYAFVIMEKKLTQPGYNKYDVILVTISLLLSPNRCILTSVTKHHVSFIRTSSLTHHHDINKQETANEHNAFTLRYP